MNVSIKYQRGGSSELFREMIQKNRLFIVEENVRKTQIVERGLSFCKGCNKRNVRYYNKCIHFRIISNTYSNNF